VPPADSPGTSRYRSCTPLTVSSDVRHGGSQ
jgi:hypothetical protein